jgi:oxygen-dependent protoporphyrinogen oxidase
MPRFLELERRERSVTLALWRAMRRAGATASGTSGARWSLFVTLRDGMEDLIRVLGDRLPPGALRAKERVIGLERQGNRWRVGLDHGEHLGADAVVLATEAHQAARLVRYVDPALSQFLREITYASSATVSLGYRRDDVPHPLDGFGFVVPRIEGRAALACTFSSVKYPGRAPDGHVLLRVFLGGALDPSVLEGDDTALEGLARAEVAAALGISASPVLTRVARHPQSMPQYVVGHLARMDAIEHRMKSHPGLTLAGAAYRGVGIADSVRAGESAADQLMGPSPGSH